jgi:hypothetical protein
MKGYRSWGTHDQSATTAPGTAPTAPSTEHRASGGVGGAPSIAPFIFCRRHRAGDGKTIIRVKCAGDDHVNTHDLQSAF